MNFNKEDVYERVYFELYKAKDSYGVDVLTEIYNYLTKVIEKKLKKTNIMTNQDAKWYTNCNLAIYKECFGITPLGKFSDMDPSGADKKIIPIDKYLGAFYYGYIFIVPKEKDGGPVPYSGDYKNDDKFMLTVRNGDFVLEKFNDDNIKSDQMAKKDQDEKKKLLEKENEELTTKIDKLAGDIKNEKDLNAKKRDLNAKTKKLKEKTKELKKAELKKEELKKADLTEEKKLEDLKKDIDDLTEEIE